jgi:hypothetical protein
MLKADYESRADTIQITLDDIDRLSGGSDLRTAAEQHDLDAEALIAISRATLAAPDRPVRLELGDRIVD